MKRIIGLGLVLACSIVLIGTLLGGCGKKSEDKNKSKSAGNKVAIYVGDNPVYLDEVKYYMYTSQATYEIYFYAHNKIMDWSEKKDKTTWENAVKGSVLDSMARRECFYSLRKDYNIKVDDEAKQEIARKVANYYTNSDEKLKSKIDIKKKSLDKLFYKAYIAEMVRDIMNTTEKGSADKFYKEWADKNEVECEPAYFDISFKNRIFTKKDMEITGSEEVTRGDSSEDDTYNPADNGGINVNDEELQ